MADLTITVPNAVVPRIQAAFGVTNAVTGEHTPATVDQIRAAIKSFVKERVLSYEAESVASAKRGEVSGEEW